MTNPGESAYEIDTAHAEAAEKLVVWRHIDIEAILTRWRTVRRSAAFLEFVTVQWIYMMKPELKFRRYKFYGALKLINSKT